MLRRQLHRGRAIDRVHARGEHRDRRSRRPDRPAQIEIHQRAFAAPNPVLLHDADFFRPARQLFQIAQQLVRVLRDPQKPLLQFALLDRSVLMPPAHPAHHLLVRQHGSALRTPVHLALLAIRQSRFVELQKEPLIPAVVIRQAGRNLARPVIGEPKALHLHLHGRNIRQRPLLRRSVVLDRRILRRQSERIPPHGMKHVVAVHPHVASQRVADRIIAHVSHVQRAGRVGKHLQNVILRLGRSAASAA